MSDSIKAYSINLKNTRGEWLAIPSFYQTAYQAYTAYCTQNELKPMSIDEFYGVFNTLANADFLSALINAVGGAGALPINVGGTGATDADTARNNLNVYSRSEMDNRFTELTNTVNALSEKLDKFSPDLFGITVGEGAPTEDTEGTIYFRIESMN